MSIDRQVEYWRNGSREDLETAELLLHHERFRHGMFLLHLAVEKCLKAHVCKKTQQTAPKLHNLLRLAEIAGVSLDASQTQLLADFGPYQIEGRYPETVRLNFDRQLAYADLNRAKEFLAWLTAKL